METLPILKDKALEAYNACKEDGKKFMRILFGEDTFEPPKPKKVTDRVKTFEDACKELGIDPDDSDYAVNDGTDDEVAFKKIKIIVRALNEGWNPDWNNDREYKWYPWFYLNTPGFRFGGSGFTYSHSGTAGGSRLCFKTEELSNYAAKQFLELYKTFMA